MLRKFRLIEWAKLVIGQHLLQDFKHPYSFPINQSYSQYQEENDTYKGQNWCRSRQPDSERKMNLGLPNFLIWRILITIYFDWISNYPDIPIPVPGHFLLWHIDISEESPLQFFPPLWGIGLLQTRVLVFDPPPQEWLQADHLFQLPHSPSTRRWFDVIILG